jgi:hypothetical protein
MNIPRSDAHEPYWPAIKVFGNVAELRTFPVVLSDGAIRLQA